MNKYGPGRLLYQNTYKHEYVHPRFYLRNFGDKVRRPKKITIIINEDAA
jgi:hypothetical protein